MAEVNSRVRTSIMSLLALAMFFIWRAESALAQSPANQARLIEAAKQEGEVVIWGQAGAERRAFIKYKQRRQSVPLNRL